jgi:hypothetical protein
MQRVATGWNGPTQRITKYSTPWRRDWALGSDNKLKLIMTIPPKEIRTNVSGERVVSSHI